MNPTDTLHLSDIELERIFEERALALSRRATGSVEAAGDLLLTFLHGAMTFAVDLRVVLRVLPPRSTTRIPNAPSHLEHVVYEGGRIVSILNPSTLLGRVQPVTGEEQTVLLEADASWLGVSAARVLGPRRFETSQLAAPSSALPAHAAPCVSGIASDLTIVLDGTALVRALRHR